MGRYFGTDGIRGKANETLSLTTAVNVGRYLGYAFKGKKLIIGQDTRLSSSMFVHAIAAGACSGGADVYVLGVCATPALAYITRVHDFACGVMISASHNPYYDNGIKCFSSDGLKIDDALEQAIEAYLDGETTIVEADSSDIGTVFAYSEGLDVYLDYLKHTSKNRFDGLKIVLDCANGSAISSAAVTFEALGAQVIALCHQPDGFNINGDCGSTHPELLQETVVAAKADLGFAFDGDADRCLAVDHTGQLVDGDMILYILGKFMKEENTLKNNTVVSTVMANLGFIQSAARQGMAVVNTQVGDKYVFQEMDLNGYTLGGEQSGHIILKDYATTGDGVLTAIKLTEVAVMSSESLNSLTQECQRFPQLLENVVVGDKARLLSHEAVIGKIAEITQLLGDDGRILVRPSGTEPLVRVMVEAKTDELCRKHVSDMIKVIESISYR